MNICVIGLGKIGLPLAVHFARKGHKVIGVDINELTIELVNRGLEPFPKEEYLQEYLSEVVSAGRLVATNNTSRAVASSEVVVVVVPLFVGKDAKADFVVMDSVTEEIANGIEPGTLISYETTLPIGTTRERFLPILEKISGLKVGSDFNLVYSPERVLTGRIFSDLKRYPKIVGGITPNCTERGRDFYQEVIEFDKREDLPKPNGVWLMDSCESAEFVKLAETTYRDVNIGLANQFSKFAISRNLDINDIIIAANSQPFSNIHTPGISVGGHCIPIYPQFYLSSDPSATLVAAARKTNDGMPEFYVSLLERAIGDLRGKSVLVMGVAYREKVKETAFSGAFALKDSLMSKGAIPYFVDPLYENNELYELGFRPFEAETSDLIEAVIIHTAHQEFLCFELEALSRVQFLIDGRNLLRKISDPQINR